MKVDLAQLTRQRGVKRKRIELRPIVPTGVLAADLFAIYKTSLDIWSQCATDVVANFTLPIRLDAAVTDADGAQLQWLVDQAARQADSTVIFQTERLGRWVTRVGNWHGTRTIAAVKSATGVDVEPFIRLTDVNDILQEAIRSNVSLIRDMNARRRASIEQIIYQGFVGRWSKRQLANELAAVMGKSKKRAMRIATDQLHKLSITLDAYRNEQMGILFYDWETQRDSRVRPEHRRRQGKRFAWSVPPPGGHPGFEPGCRCHAIPVLELD